MKKILLVFLVLTALLLLPGVRAASAQDNWSNLENRHVIISHIDIHILPVFDLQNPRENYFIGRWANLIHINTRTEIIRPAILFTEGEPVNELQIRASERLLRSLPYVRDAEIIPSENADSSVTAIVKVHDAWSLKLNLDLSYVGGESEWNVMLREYNLLGLGKQIQIGYNKTIDRRFTDFAYQDPLLLGTRWVLSTEYRGLSDGAAKYAALYHPFYDVNTPWAAGFMANDLKNIQTFYERGEPIYNLTSNQSLFSLFYQFRFWRHNKSVQRAGLEYRLFAYRYHPLNVFQTGVLPLYSSYERHFQGLLGFWQYYQDDYISRQNINFMEKLEDFNLGWDAQLRIGYFPETLGSTHSAVYTEGSVEKGIAVDDHSFLSGNISWHGLEEAGRLKHLWSSSDIRFFDQHFTAQTLMLSFQFTNSHNPLPEDVSYLGGKDRLRGYMNHFRIGDARWMFTLEDRIFTSFNLLGIFQLGFVAYLDAGGIRELSTGRWSKNYASVGTGLRIGNLKSAFGRVISLTVATPVVRESGVKGIQILLSSEI